jgi:hypothetical protein
MPAFSTTAVLVGTGEGIEIRLKDHGLARPRFPLTASLVSSPSWRHGNAGVKDIRSDLHELLKGMTISSPAGCFESILLFRQLYQGSGDREEAGIS